MDFGRNASRKCWNENDDDKIDYEPESTKE